jgi:uncharacterized membrane protein
MTDLRVINKLKHSLLCAVQFFIGYLCAIAVKQEASFGFILSICLFISIYVVYSIVDKIYKYTEK